jgi:triose/dihydroxyacetone kinase / FAD-AMP lyase (cyclizing)
VMVNNLGATTTMELAIVGRHAIAFLESKGFAVERIYAGTYLSSLDMAGISISVLGINDERLRWLDAATTAPAWPNALKQRPGRREAQMASKVSANVGSPTGKDVQTDTGRRAKRAIDAACQALIGAEGELTELDRATGDGDLGISMKRAAVAVRDSVESYPLDDVSATLRALGHTLQHELGGSSGPLYGVLCLRCGHILEDSGSTGPAQWAEAIDQGCRAIGELGGAKSGDRTMLDALDPFVESLKRIQGNLSRETLLAAVEEAERGVDATARMMPRLGRSSYLGDRVLGHPDPGAKAVAIWLRAASEALFTR